MLIEVRLIRFNNMAGQPQSHQPPNQPRFRFSLAGLFVAIFGLGVGLARWNAVPGDWPGAILASAGCWFIIGMFQEVWRAARYKSTDANGADPFSRSIHCGVLIFASSLMALVLALSVAERLLKLDTTYDFVSATEYVNSFTFLTLIMAYGHGVRRSDSPTKWQRLLQWLAAAAGLLWLSLLCSDLMRIPALVHFAIGGVYQHMPLRWVDVLPDSYRQSTSDFINGAYCAAAAATFAACCMIALSARWNRGISIRYAWFAGCALSLTYTAFLVHRGHAIAKSAVAPHMTDNLFGRPWFEFAVGIALLLAGATFVAIRTSSMPYGNSGHDRGLSGTGLASHPLVIGLLLIAIVSRLALDIHADYLSAGMPFWTTYFKYFLPLRLVWPFFLMNIAAALVLGRALWASFRFRPQTVAVGPRYDNWKFITFWVLAFVSIPLFVCAAAWLGFAMNLTTR